MTATASLHEIKLELKNLDPKELSEICLRLAKYKKENKELLHYLLFQAGDEAAFIEDVKADLDAMFDDLPKGNVYFVKKGLRKILRFLNKQVRFSSQAETEVDLRIHFCLKTVQASVPISRGTVLGNLYDQQLKKIESVLGKLPEDLQGDYERSYEAIQR